MPAVIVIAGGLSRVKQIMLSSLRADSTTVRGTDSGRHTHFYPAQSYAQLLTSHDVPSSLCVMVEHPR